MEDRPGFVSSGIQPGTHDPRKQGQITGQRFSGDVVPVEIRAIPAKLGGLALIDEGRAGRETQIPVRGR